MRSRTEICVLIALVVALWTSDPASARDQYSEEGASACLKCHENDKVMAIRQTAHGKKDDPNAPFAGHQCEACHGPSKLHMQFPMQVEQVRFTKGSKVTAAQQNAACLDCHEEMSPDQWQADPHRVEGLICSSCHVMHDPVGLILDRTTQAGACASCHEKILGEVQNGSPHPVAKGEITCSDCHRPHADFSFESCIACHVMTPEEFAKQTPRTRGFHENAQANDLGCGECHKGMAHGMPEGLARPEVLMDDPHEF